MKRLITITYEADNQDAKACEGTILLSALETLNGAGASDISIQTSTVPGFRPSAIEDELRLPEFMRRKQVTA